MKNNLLITIGDSWTEGVGCYEPELISKYKSGEITSTELYVKSMPRFKSHGWPSILATKMGYDVLNLGRGGASNSGEAKRLIIDEDNYGLKKKYNNVFLIFLISDPGRFSFYSGGELLDIRLNDDTCLSWEVAKEYVKYVIKDIQEDTFKETACYLKMVENFCTVNDYTFFYGSAFSDMQALDLYYKHPNNLHYYEKHHYKVHYSDLLKSNMWAHCNHPNELGYEMIATEMYTKIKELLGEKL
jgi:hypothetical protein